MLNSFEKILYRLMMILMLLLATISSQIRADDRSDIYLINIDAPIGPASYDYLKQSMATANTKRAHLIIIQLDTPGGLVSSMREMTQLILNSAAPVAVYVAPSGANAASAGAFIVYSAHIASMAPGTNIGAASPLPIGSDAPLPSDPDRNKDPSIESDSTPDISSKTSAAQTKAVEDLTAYMRALAETHKRNAKLGVDMIIKGDSFSAQEALRNNIIDYISTDIDRLLQQLDGKQNHLERSDHYTGDNE